MNLNKSLTAFAQECKHLDTPAQPKTVCKTCAIQWAQEIANLEALDEALRCSHHNNKA